MTTKTVEKMTPKGGSRKMRDNKTFGNNRKEQKPKREDTKYRYVA